VKANVKLEDGMTARIGEVYHASFEGIDGYHIVTNVIYPNFT
jgi:hypothetical protein